VTLDGVPVGNPQAVIDAARPPPSDPSRSRAMRMDELFTQLTSRRAAWKTAHPGQTPLGDLWLDVEPSTRTMNAVITLLSATYPGYPRVHLRTPHGWLDGNLDMPMPGGPSSEDLVHSRVRALLEAGRVSLSWQSDAACDGVPEDTSVERSQLDAYLSQSCASAGGRCIDDVSVHANNEAPFSDVVEALETFERHGAGAFRFQVWDGVVPDPGKSRRACGQPVKTFAHVGGLTSEKVRAVVQSHSDALRACYELEAQKNPELRGTVGVGWYIAEAGDVSKASIASTTLANERVESCILRQVESWRFPPSDAPTRIASYPFRFGVSDTPDAGASHP
jgi:hypothetical protein